MFKFQYVKENVFFNILKLKHSEIIKCKKKCKKKYLIFYFLYYYLSLCVIFIFIIDVCIDVLMIKFKVMDCCGDYSPLVGGVPRGVSEQRS